VGQLFIFYTLKKFGPVVFTIIMTIRQMLSMIISCVIFGHPIAWPSAVRAGAQRARRRHPDMTKVHEGW
jgi:adenosine 3'-phospho 5'-phosphosulfate transporter B2